MKTADSVHLFEQLLERAVERFFADMVANPFYADFLQNADLEHLKASQLANLLEAVHEDGQVLFERFKQIALIHFKQGLPYVEYHDAFDRLHGFLLDELDECGSHAVTHDEIDAYIRDAMNASAAGYLAPALEDDKKTLVRQIKQQIDIPAVKEHLQWILEVIEDIGRMNAMPDIEFDERKCKCGSWLHSKELKKHIEDPATREDILETHHEIHLITKNIYRSIARNDYHKIFIDYIILVRQSMYLYNELSINVTQQALIEDVSKDALTGLLNRRYLNDVLKSEAHLHALNGGAFSVVMFDLDHFKTVNDTCGHPAGDRVLVGFADLLKRHVRKTDNIFRYGGEEFLALLPGTTAQDAYTLCEKIRMDFAAQAWQGCLGKLPVTVSIGIAEYSDKLKANPRRVIFEADANLYRAKQLGRNRTVAQRVRAS